MAAGSESPPPLGAADLSLVDQALNKLDQLHQLSVDPQLGLRNSPPYLPELVSETAVLLEQVWEPYRGPALAGCPGPRADGAKFLRIHIRNLLDKSSRAVLLFRQGRERIFDETSNYRRNLTKLSLLFSHILWELRAMFPGGSFEGDTYRVKKAEAGRFWRQCFGNRCIVPWTRFKEKLENVHAFEDGMESMALKSTIDLTCNDHISVFEFDIFTRLFQPWRSLLKNWNHLAVIHPGYMAFLTYDQVVARLEHHLHRPGSYIFRLSCTRMGEWAIGHVTTKGNIVQTIPQNTPLYLALIQGFKEGCYLYPDGRDVNPDLSSLCEPAQTCKVRVTEEQYELYCDIGSTFQMCKICTDRDKNTRIQPCGHLLCQTCLTGWQKSAGPTCPYCRCDIKGTESVLIEPHQPGSRAPEHGDQEDTDEDDQEDTDEDDHEDIEAIVKEMLALRTQSSGVTCQAPPGGPPLGTGLLSPPPPSQAPTAELKPADCFPQGHGSHQRQRRRRRHQNQNRCEGPGSGSRNQERPGDWRCFLSDSPELITEDASNSQQDDSGGVAMIRPSVPKREEKRSLKTSLASER